MVGYIKPNCGRQSDRIPMVFSQVANKFSKVILANDRLVLHLKKLYFSAELLQMSVQSRIGVPELRPGEDIYDQVRLDAAGRLYGFHYSKIVRRRTSSLKSLERSSLK